MIHDTEKSNPKPLRSSKRDAWIRTFIVLFGCFAALFTAFVWRVHTDPVDLAPVKHYIERSLHAEETGRDVKIDRLLLQWPDLKGPLLLVLEGVKIVDGQGHLQASVDSVAIAFSRGHLLRGQVSPKVLVIRKPSLRVVRAADGSIDIGLAGQNTRAADPSVPEDQTALLQKILEYIAHPGREDRHKSPLSALEMLRIEQARIVVEDHILQKSWRVPSADIGFRSAKKGLVSDIYLDLTGHGPAQEPSHVEGKLSYIWDSRVIGLDLVFDNFDASLVTTKIPALSDLADKTIVFDAKAKMTLDQNFIPYEAQIDLSGREGALENVDLHVNADMKQTAAGVSGPVSIRIDTIRQDQIAALWPKSLNEEAVKEWLVDNLSAGTFHDLNARIDIAAQKGEQSWNVDTPDIIAGFAFEDMDVDYRAPMTKVSKAKGSGTFDYRQEKLNIDVEAGKIGALEIKKGEVELTEIIAEGKGKADIYVKLDGPLAGVFDYIKNEPISFESEFGPGKIGGEIDAAVNVAFPAVGDVKVEDVKVGVTGTVTQASLPGVVKYLTLSGGPFNVKIAGNKLTVKGSGQLEGRAVDAEYEAFLDSTGQSYISRIRAKITADNELRDRMGIDLSEFIDGPAQVDVTYTEYEGGRAEAQVKANIQPARFFIQPFGYEKPAGVEGNISLLAVLQGEELKEVKNLKGIAPRFVIEDTNLNFRQEGGETLPQSGKIPRFVIDKSVGTMDFETLAGGQLKVTINSQVFDLLPFLDEEEGEPVYDDPPMIISIAADRMLADKEESIKHGRIYADIDAKGSFNRLEMDGIAGGGDIYLRYKPDETGQMALRFEADDAGAALKTFGLYGDMIGGKIVVHGEPIRGVFDRSLTGKAQITDFKVVRTPALARLLGMMSLSGVVSSLEGEGLSFAKLESDFKWVYRPEGSTLVLKNGRTSGNSLGLTFDGTFNKKDGEIDVTGTIVPLSMLNKVVGSLPVVGNILGGESGLFAATYSMKGKGQSVETSVNPLSVLAPGIVRTILFE